MGRVISLTDEEVGTLLIILPPFAVPPLQNPGDTEDDLKANAVQGVLSENISSILTKLIGEEAPPNNPYPIF